MMKRLCAPRTLTRTVLPALRSASRSAAALTAGPRRTCLSYKPTYHSLVGRSCVPVRMYSGDSDDWPDIGPTAYEAAQQKDLQAVKFQQIKLAQYKAQLENLGVVTEWLPNANAESLSSYQNKLIRYLQEKYEDSGINMEFTKLHLPICLLAYQLSVASNFSLEVLSGASKSGIAEIAERIWPHVQQRFPNLCLNPKDMNAAKLIIQVANSYCKNTLILTVSQVLKTDILDLVKADQADYKS